ncbi:aldehyde dehydrogenase [Paraburkholderia strydomiana]|uniref:Aldehyde dehydrogenase n=1 Tax=Paraburkholderia strydomiana TaxID=1245417 RepID=A0ABW9EF69_9BURK
MKSFEMRIGAMWRGASNGETFESTDPYTAQPWASFPRGTAQDVDAAVNAAHAAFENGPWTRMTASARGLLLHRLGDAIAANAAQLADMEVKDNGKLRAEMLAQMEYLPQWFYYYAGLADKVEGAVTPIDRPGMMHYVTYEPLGVVAAIAPWNSPLLLAAWKIAPALAAGNTVVIKPSEFSSASTLEFARLCEDVGFPPGVVNVVTGFGNEVGQPLVVHPLVARVAFTGSDSGGRAVALNAAETFKRVSLELGGKSANIVFDDAHLDDAVKGVVSGIFAATGQTCMAGSRLLVQSSIHDEFVARLTEFVKTARLGDPSDPATHIGPVSTQPQLDKTLSYIAIAKAEGAHCRLGGERSRRPGCEQGLFVEPTIFTGVRNDMRIAREEVFGPVLAVIPFDTEDEAVAIANDNPYGLAAGVWTQNLQRAITLPRRLHVGTVWVNAYRVVSYMAPFGGVKASGMGRENGVRAIHEYLEARSVFINPVPGIANPFVLSR